MNVIPTLAPLIDADPMVYASGFVADTSMIKKLMEEEGLSKEEAKGKLADIDYQDHALQVIKTTIDNILVDVFSEHPWYKVYYSGDTNFRTEVATIKVYKGNRDRSAKPKYFKEIREYIATKYNAERVEGQEADDAIGIEQFSHKDKSTCIVSIDKDLLMIPGYHYNPNKKEFFYQNIDEANRHFFWQMLVGDTTDNIPGIHKIGPKTATKLSEESATIEDFRRKVEELYQKQYGDKWEFSFTEIANLLWIRRREGERCPYTPM